MPFVTVAPTFAPFLNLVAVLVVGLMAAEFCGSGCGWCGRCDAEEMGDADWCVWCERSGCDGQCDAHFEQLEAWASEAEPSNDRSDPAA